MTPAPQTRRRRWLWILWLLALAQLLVGALIYPVSSGVTRAAGAGLFFVVWFGLAGLCWRLRAVRYGWLVVTFLALEDYGPQ